MKLPVTVLMIVKNGAETITAALDSVKWAEALVIIDDGSTDATSTIAKKYTRTIYTAKGSDFAAKRNQALESAQTDWVFYLDADEVVTPKLQAEIEAVVRRQEPGVFEIRRENYFLGRKMYPDWTTRLFHTSCLKGWQGKVHETALSTVTPQRLDQPLLHFTHRDITSMLQKTNEWSEIEAELRDVAHHPPMAWWRLISIALKEGWRQLAKLQVWRYGREGWFEGYFQIIDKWIVYTKLWERQNLPKESE